MRVKIIGKNTIAESSVVNAETGEVIKGVTRVEFIIDAETQQHGAIIYVHRANVEWEGTARFICQRTGDEIIEANRE